VHRANNEHVLSRAVR